MDASNKQHRKKQHEDSKSNVNQIINQRDYERHLLGIVAADFTPFSVLRLSPAKEIGQDIKDVICHHRYRD